MMPGLPIPSGSDHPRQPGLTGTHAIVDSAIEEAGQSLFTAADVPLARTDELTAAVQGPAARAVLEARIRHIVRNGHTAAADAEIEPYRLLDKAVEMMRVARARCGVTDTNPASLAAARKTAADACALGLAVIDRIDVELAETLSPNRHATPSPELGE